MTQISEIEMLNRTHSTTNTSFAKILEIIKHKIIVRGALPYASIDYQLEIVNQLCDFPLGRFILERKGANGFWTDYMISHPQKGRISRVNIEGKPFNPIEDFLLNRCPIVIAHQERFSIFQHLIQKMLTENMILASIPCGLMKDLLTLDFLGIANCKLIGIDVDEESLLLARQCTNEKKIFNVQFLQQDAWQMQFNEELDIITSSGLNVYESDPKKVLDLYRKFFTALKPGGSLITSVLTYPPGEAVETDWDLNGISPDDLLLEQILHKDILDIKWRNFRSTDELCKEFEQVGFSNIFVYFDKHHIFPTILAQKPF